MARDHVDFDARRQLLGEGGGAPPGGVPAHGDAVAPGAVVADQAAVAILSGANFSLMKFNLQRPPSSQSQGFEVHVLESSHGWLAATVASYCPSRTSELQPTVITKHSD